MSTLRRVTRYLPNGEQGAEQYDLLCHALEGEVAAWLGGAPLDGWPQGHWSHEGFSARCSEWRPDAPAQERLLHLELRQEAAEGQALTIVATLGCSGAGSPFLFESWSLVPSHQPLTLAKLPVLFAGLAAQEARDEDGLLAGRRYNVRAERVPALLEFLATPTRRLPLLVLSPAADGGYPLGLSDGFMAASRGVAHIVLLQDERAVKAWCAGMPSHGCYGGAARLYLPGFQRNDRASTHPYKTAREIERIGWEEAEQALFVQIAAFAAPLFEQFEELAELERAQDRAFHAQQAELRQQRALLTNAPDMEALYYEVERERDEARLRADSLQAEVTRLKDELRREKWKTHGLFAGREEESEAETEASLYFSTEARRTWRSFDPERAALLGTAPLPQIAPRPDARGAECTRLRPPGERLGLPPQPHRRRATHHLLPAGRPHLRLRAVSRHRPRRRLQPRARRGDRCNMLQRLSTVEGVRHNFGWRGVE